MIVRVDYVKKFEAGFYTTGCVMEQHLSLA